MVVGAAGDRMRRSGFHHIMNELGAWFVGVVEQGDEIAAVEVAGRQFLACELLIVASFREEMDDLTLASHVHGVVLADECKYESAGDEIGLQQEDWGYV